MVTTLDSSKHTYPVDYFHGDSRSFQGDSEMCIWGALQPFAGMVTCISPMVWLLSHSRTLPSILFSRERALRGAVFFKIAFFKQAFPKHEI